MRILVGGTNDGKQTDIVLDELQMECISSVSDGIDFNIGNPDHIFFRLEHYLSMKFRYGHVEYTVMRHSSLTEEEVLGRLIAGYNP